jgi:hypothetical protein
MKSVMDKRKGPLFQPAKKHILDYNVNYMSQKLAVIRRQWDRTNKPMIDRVLFEICGKLYTPTDDDLLMCGILDYTEAVTNATMRTWRSQAAAEAERYNVYYSLYAQFFHQMTSQVEALFLDVLTRNGYEGEKFSRNVLYASKGPNEESVRELEGFAQLDEMYSIWNFIKHNSLSTFNTLKEHFPKALREGNYTQGELACFHVKFDDSLIDSILTGLDRFVKEYCRMVFKEVEQEAQWNSDEHFLRVVSDAIKDVVNPMGLPDWI